MAITKTVGPLIQGISQQSVRDRLPGQQADQTNMLSDPVEGMVRRPGADFVSSLFTSADQHEFDTFAVGGEEFDLAYRDGVLRVFDESGTERTVTLDSGTAPYIATVGKFSVASIPDEGVFLSNDAVVTAMRADTSDDTVANTGVIYSLGGKFGATYSIRIESGETAISVSHTTPNGSSSAHTADVTTTAIVLEITDLLNADPTFIAENLSASRVGDVIHVFYTSSPKVLVISADDGEAGLSLRAFTDRVNDVSDLSRYAPHGKVVRVEGTSNTGDDTFYMRFSSDVEDAAVGSNFGKTGVWLETVGPGELLGFDKATLPHLLEKTGDNFLFRQADWEDRRVGDSESNPEPSFIGNAISDIGTFQGRLAMLAGPSVTMSRTKKPRDFWSESATTVTKTDPLDFRSDTVEVDRLFAMVPQDRDLVVFSARAQFIIFGRNALTPDNASLVLSTTFECDTGATPAPSGRNVFFCFESGTFTGVKEFFTQGSADANDSRPVTDHVDKLILGRPLLMTSTSNFNTLLVHTDTDRQRAYVYQFVWVNEEKAQSAWHKWDFADKVLRSRFDNSRIKMVLQRGEDYYTQVLDLDVTSDAGLGYHAHLDVKSVATEVGTTFTTPYAFTSSDVVVVQGAGCPNPGLLADVLSVVGSTVTLKDDMLEGTVLFGERYLSSFQLTKPLYRDRSGDVVQQAALVIDRIDITFKDTGFIGTTVRSRFRADKHFNFTGRVVGSPDNRVGQAAITSGVFQVPFSENTQYADLLIHSSDHRPMNVDDIDYTGQVHVRGQRLERNR